MPEIRKFKRLFPSEILCASFWGMNIVVGTRTGMMLLDRSGEGRIYPLVTKRRFSQITVLDPLRIMITISGKTNKVCM